MNRLLLAALALALAGCATSPPDTPGTWSFAAMGDTPYSDAEEAQLIATQTARGAASLLLNQHSHPEIEIDKVTTPEGCTIAGLNEMEHQGLSSALIKGIIASYEKISRIKN